ncbi:uracil-DNA glycosylase [Spongiibacter sp. KMU-166]|uniref:Uracil-DNA glycosylase n=1 Tax=Spongiibacter thalassae TaxID=2721624 RepID=A0ABX1GFV3_9GAMM|nr:uracil-DNA glycosylase [Spongiibacter thalassae]NKI17079.1 uracil-DNA glycosylase [Spongiibacter thalassae]
MSVRAVQLEESWLEVLAEEFDRDYMRQLRGYLRERKAQGAQIFPPGPQWFAALNSTPFKRVKIVVLGQDPYHGPGQAHGLCFSVLPGVAVPPSLQNIYKELHADVGMTIPGHGYLQAWAEQGVLLLNNVLTVEQGQAGAHQGRGWEQFTDAAVAALNSQREGLVFLLWGSHAQKKGAVIDASRHLVLKAPHPSPLSAYRGFFGCGHFSAANRYLESRGESAIDWQLPLEA